MKHKLSLILGKHHIRKTFYVLTLVLSLVVLFLAEIDIITDRQGLITTLILIFTDLVAMLYDPCPVKGGVLFGRNPIRWVREHFKRAWDDSEE